MLRMIMLASMAIGMFATGGAAAQNDASRADDRVAYEQVLRDADELVKSGNPAKAYALLEPLEFAHAGEERFDYLIGIAALDSGKPDKATFALERVLTVNPNSAAARLDMARAYYQLGDLPRAKTEFLAVSRQDISASARANVEKYLDEIAVQESGKNTRLAGYVEGAFGHDSNVNNSTTQSQVQVDAITTGPVTLNPINIATADNYHAMAAGGEIRHSLSNKWELYAGGDWRRRDYNTQRQFDAVDVGGRAGVTYGGKAERFRVGILDVRDSLEGLHNYDTAGFNGEWRHVFSPANQSNLFFQKIKYRYADVVMQPNNFDQQIMGLGWLHVTVDGRATLFGSLYRGTEKDASAIVTTVNSIPVISYAGRADGDKQVSGLRLGGQAALGSDTTLFANAGVQDGNYGKTNPFFLRQRKDRLSDLAVGANWHFEKLWSLRPQLNYFRNNSNIVIYSYARKDVSLTVRRDFR